ncbi:unnamed protein product [Eruca vesicaria subsp. sativa]|uniref:Protein kinase domain-containing protein n=1 Tax=Eruca vesicaria subsp. sativa TaxID=29727 RepID=A0ABC8M7Z3_ERUVS|nr:unnamed protein product [Eruca vesicaria subsp. sativa]
MLLSPQKYVLVCFVTFTALSVSTRQQSRTDCQSSTCGTVRIEYSFGTSSDCVDEGKFLLRRCDEKEQKLFLNSSNLEVLRISFHDDGEVEVLMDVLSLCNHKERDGGHKVLKNLRNVTRFPVILDWTLKEGTCQQAENTSFCGENSKCTNTTTNFWYTCTCLEGFEGNPFVQHGCKDMDEFQPNVKSCGEDQTCKKVDGVFRCKKKKESVTIILPWPDRLIIAAEIAETLSYLHFFAPVPIVHGDIKPENILLTQTLTVKLCDFWASRQVPNNTGQLTTLVQGTWVTSIRSISEKSDVYSFGVVLLEMVSGQKALTFNPSHGERVLVNHIDAAFKENRLSEVMDQRVVTADNQAVIHQVALLGMSCTKMCGVERPDMRKVAEDLRGLQASRQVVQHEAGPSALSKSRRSSRYFVFV